MLEATYYLVTIIARSHIMIYKQSLRITSFSGWSPEIWLHDDSNMGKNLAMGIFIFWQYCVKHPVGFSLG